MHSSLLARHGKLIKQNEMMRLMVYDTYDRACDRQCTSFLELFENMLTSTLSNPWVFLKGATAGDAVGSVGVANPRDRIPKEIESRSGVETVLNKWLQDIPTDELEIDTAVDKVQQLVLKTYSFIRSQVCDQVELFAESFFKEPMLRRLTEDMAGIALSTENKEKYKVRRDRLHQDK